MRTCLDATHMHAGLCGRSTREISRFPRKELLHMPGSLTTPDRPGTRAGAPVHVAFRLLYAVGIRNTPVSRLDGWPMLSPVNASPAPSREPAHDSGPVWVATPSTAGDSHPLLLAGLPAHTKAVRATRVLGGAMGLRQVCPSKQPIAEHIANASGEQGFQHRRQIDVASVAFEKAQRELVGSPLNHRVRWGSPGPGKSPPPIRSARSPAESMLDGFWPKPRETRR